MGAPVFLYLYQC